jgi:hypothetical protein
MKKIMAILVVVVSLGMSASAGFAQDQEAAKESSSGLMKSKQVQPYRLDYSFNEVADGKIVNTRHYSMNLTSGNSNEIKIGTRVPVAVASSPSAPTSMQYQYLDVGTSIWSQLREHSDELTLAVRAEVSNLDVGTSAPGGTLALPPVVRQIKIDGETLLVVGKPIVIGSVDDPNSKRQFQLEVTITKLR